MSTTVNDLHPLDPGESAAQLAAVGALVPDSARLVDLGAGSGRLAAPLAAEGHQVLAVDSDRTAVEEGGWSQKSNIEVLVEDMLGVDATWFRRGPFDGALCLGNTLSLFLELAQIDLLFARIGRALREGGVFLVDDFPVWGWEAVDSGEWPSGVTEDGEAQLVWVPGKPLFAFRRGSEVAPDCELPRPGERLLRLWSLSELTSVAEVHGLTGPHHQPEGLMIRFARA